MEERYEALVMHLSKCRARGRKRVQQIAALMRAESIDGPVFGKEGGMVASILENALDSAEGQMRENYGKVGSGDPKTQQAAAKVLMYIEESFQKAFNARFECNYGHHVPMLRRLLEKGETVDGLKQYADAWIEAGKGELVHNDRFVNSRLWGDATVGCFTTNLNRIKTHVRPRNAREIKWVMPDEAKA